MLNPFRVKSNSGYPVSSAGFDDHRYRRGSNLPDHSSFWNDQASNRRQKRRFPFWGDITDGLYGFSPTFESSLLTNGSMVSRNRTKCQISGARKSIIRNSSPEDKAVSFLIFLSAPWVGAYRSELSQRRLILRVKRVPAKARSRPLTPESATLRITMHASERRLGLVFRFPGPRSPR